MGKVFGLVMLLFFCDARGAYDAQCYPHQSPIPGSPAASALKQSPPAITWRLGSGSGKKRSGLIFIP